MSLLLDVGTVALVTLGLGFFLAGTVGLLRFPDSLSRLHALTKADTLGLGFVVLGAAIQAPDPAVAGKLILVWLLVLLASATAGPLIGAVARRSEPQR